MIFVLRTRIRALIVLVAICACLVGTVQAARCDVCAWGWGAAGQLGNGANSNSNQAAQVIDLAGVVSVAGGGQHSLALMCDGTVWSWGDNTYGQLGQDSNVSTNTRGQADGRLGNIVAIAAGMNHSLALRSDGTVQAFGYNGYGQLGDGTTTDRNYNVPVSGLTGVIAISGGKNHSMALRADGIVWTWGANANGQLGDGTTNNRTSPVQVTGLTGVIAIAAGASHSLALRFDGTVWAWGPDDLGQLGDGRSTEQHTPVQVNGLAGVTAISASWSHSLALSSDGTVWGWGWNGYGQLGDGTNTNRHSAVQVSGLTHVSAISASQTHSIALMLDGTVRSWGCNGGGDLGDGTNTDRWTPVSVSGLTNVTAIATGYDHNLVLRPDNQGRAWGFDHYGQLGDGGFSGDRTTAVNMNGLPSVMSFAGGSYHTLALGQDGTVWAWGLNAYGQVGDGTQTDRGAPVHVSGLANVVAIAAGERQSYALKSDGTVWAWGDNTWGEIGDGTNTTRLAPVKVSGLNGVTAISSGGRFGVALRSDGTVWTWGFNNYGGLGDGTYTSRNSPVQVVGLTGVTAIASGGIGTCMALKSNGTVWTWGYGQLGGLANGSNTYNVNAPVLSQFSGVVAIASSYYTSIAIKSDGTVWAAGYNYDGELGDGSTTDRWSPVQVSGLTDVVQVAGGYEQSLALKADGTVWAWGLNDNGQLGDGTTNNRNHPVSVLGIRGATAIACGYYHSLVVTGITPSVSSMNPNPATQGQPCTLTVLGTDFQPGAKVRLAGVELPTTFVTSTCVVGKATATQMAVAGMFNVDVVNPGSFASSALQLMIVAGGPVYQLTDLGDLGGAWEYANAVNNNGQVVGVAAGATASRGFLWLPQDAFGLFAGLNDIGTLPGFASGSHQATGINDQGQVLGFAMAGSSSAAFLWLPTGAYGLPAGMKALGTFGGLISGSWAAAAINNVGQMAVNGTMTGSGATHAFRVSAAGGAVSAVDLGNLGGQYTAANTINDLGRVAGISADASGNHAFLTAPNAAINPASDNLNGTSGIEGEVFGVNGLGAAAGRTRPDGVSDSATLWLPADMYGLSAGTNLLGYLGFGQFSWANQVNASGEVVGYGSYDDTGDAHAFLWREGSGMIDLNDRVPDLFGWTLFEARGLNDRGQIVGSAFDQNGSMRAFLLTPVAAQAVASLTISPDLVIGGAGAIGTVTVAYPAGTGGLDVVIFSDDPAATVPATVHVNEGQQTATFTITTATVSTDKSFLIYAVYGTSAEAALLTVQGAQLQSLSLSPNIVTGGTSSTGTILLTGPAPTGGTDVALSSDSAAASVPASVNVAEGTTSATFTVTTTPQLLNASASLTASARGVTKTTSLPVLAPVPTGISLSPSTLYGGYSSTATVTLSGPAASGMKLNLASDKAEASVPATADVTAGSTSATFVVPTSLVSALTSANISANYDPDGGGALAAVTRSAVLTVKPFTITSLTFSPNKVYGGAASKVAVTIDAAPASALNLALSPDVAVAGMPASLTIGAGKTTTSASFTTSPVASNANATVTGSMTGSTKTATFTVLAAQLAGLTFQPTSVKSGGAAKLIVRLTSPAAAGGATVALTVTPSGQTAVSIPASVTIPAGVSQSTLNLTAKTVASTTKVNVTAGKGLITKRAVLTVVP